MHAHSHRHIHTRFKFFLKVPMESMFIVVLQTNQGHWWTPFRGHSSKAANIHPLLPGSGLSLLCNILSYVTGSSTMGHRLYIVLSALIDIGSFVSQKSPECFPLGQDGAQAESYLHHKSQLSLSEESGNSPSFLLPKFLPSSRVTLRRPLEGPQNLTSMYRIHQKDKLSFHFVNTPK